jgi:hypothetical protein
MGGKMNTAFFAAQHFFAIPTIVFWLASSSIGARSKQPDQGGYNEQ